MRGTLVYHCGVNDPDYNDFDPTCPEKKKCAPLYASCPQLEELSENDEWGVSTDFVVQTMSTAPSCVKEGVASCCSKCTGLRYLWPANVDNDVCRASMPISDFASTFPDDEVSSAWELVARFVVQQLMSSGSLTKAQAEGIVTTIEASIDSGTTQLGEVADPEKVFSDPTVVAALTNSGVSASNIEEMKDNAASTNLEELQENSQDDDDSAGSTTNLEELQENSQDDDDSAGSTTSSSMAFMITTVTAVVAFSGLI